jgi:hypothetical protein
MATTLLFLLALAGMAWPQQPPAYTPKFPGDKAHSESEAGALGYMRTLVTAQKLYKKKHGQYAGSLAALVGSGSFTRRMTKADRGEYVVGFKPKPDGYTLTLTPRQVDAAHRAFYTDESGVLRGDESGRATANSPPLS